MQQEFDISRRSFLTGAGVLGVGLAATLSGCGAPKPSDGGASKAEASKQAAPAAAPAADAKKAQAADPDLVDPKDLQKGETVDTEVLVIGAGMAGLVAANSAKDEGAKVLLIEKGEDVGTAGHSIIACESEFQKAEGINYTVDDLYNFWTENDDVHLNKDMIRYAAERSGAGIAWLGDHGVQWEGVTIPPSNPYQWPKNTFVTKANRDGRKAFILPLYEKAKAAGVEFRFNSAAVQLITNDKGDVTGVITNEGGKAVTINAKAVIVCTGGFGKNAEMLATYAPRVPFYKPPMALGKYSNGFALREGKRIGAQLVINGGTQAFYGNENGGNPDNAGQTMFVNQDGERFMDESTYIMTRSASTLIKGIQYYFAICDEDTVDTIYSATTENSVGGKDSYRETVKTPSAIAAKDIAEAARWIGCSEEKLKATIDRYNGFCEKGVDEDFKKQAKRTARMFDPKRKEPYMIDLIEKELTLLNPIKKPPFYVVKMRVDGSNLTGTQGGLKINQKTEVIDAMDKPINGLYAVGEAANGQLIGFYYTQSGTQLCFCTVYGIEAGKSAAAHVKA